MQWCDWIVLYFTRRRPWYPNRTRTVSSSDFPCQRKTPPRQRAHVSFVLMKDCAHLGADFATGSTVTIFRSPWPSIVWWPFYWISDRPPETCSTPSAQAFRARNGWETYLSSLSSTNLFSRNARVTHTRQGRLHPSTWWIRRWCPKAPQKDRLRLLAVVYIGQEINIFSTLTLTLTYLTQRNVSIFMVVQPRV